MRALGIYVLLLLLLVVPLTAIMGAPWCPECDLSPPSMAVACLLLVAGPTLGLVLVRERLAVVLPGLHGAHAPCGVFRPPRP